MKIARGILIALLSSLAGLGAAEAPEASSSSRTAAS